MNVHFDNLLNIILFGDLMTNSQIKIKKKGVSGNVSRLLLILIVAGFMAIVSFSGVSATDIVIDNTTAGGIAGAIDTAQAGDTIILEPGNYNKANQDVNIQIDKNNISIRGNGSSDSVIIDAQGASNIFTMGGGSSINLANLSFVNGRAGIYLKNNTIDIENVYFINNTASALYNNGGGTCYITIANSNFIGNSAPYGGALENYHSGSSVYNITNTNFINNSASNTGGAIAIDGDATIYYIDNCTFVNNQAGSGGAIALEKVGPTINVYNSVFTENSASYGGAIYLHCTYLSVYNSNFTANTATTNGGAIAGVPMMTPPQVSIVDNCNFDFNTAGKFGGAIDDGIGFSINNSNFTSNQATSGGGVYIEGGMMRLATSIFNSVFINNTVDAIQNETTYKAENNSIYNLSNSSVLADPNPVQQGDSFIASGVLLDTTSGQAIAGITLTITFNSETYTVTTATDGSWFYEIETTDLGDYILTVSWSGNSDYIGFTNSTTVTVQ